MYDNSEIEREGERLKGKKTEIEIEKERERGERDCDHQRKFERMKHRQK